MFFFRFVDNNIINIETLKRGKNEKSKKTVKQLDNRFYTCCSRISVVLRFLTKKLLITFFDVFGHLFKYGIFWVDRLYKVKTMVRTFLQIPLLNLLLKIDKSDITVKKFSVLYNVSLQG